MSDAIECPKCGAEIPLTETMTHQIEQRLRAELADQWEELERQHAEAWESREEELRQQFAIAQEQREAEVERLAAQMVATSVDDLHSQLAEQRERQQRMRQAHKLEVDRLTADRCLEIREKDTELKELKQQIGELKNASDRTTPTLQGEVLVQEIESQLRQRFPTDAVRVVKKGARGADIVHTVRLSCATALATALRQQLLQLAHLRAVDVSAQTADQVYGYLSSRRFIDRFTTGVDAALELKSGLDTERRSHESAWAKRETQIDRFILSSAGIYGDLRGIMGTALESVETLELGVGSDSVSHEEKGLALGTTQRDLDL